MEDDGGKATGNKRKTLRSDNGGEYIFGKLRQFFKREGVCYHLKGPRQKEVTERMNRMLVEMERSLLHGLERRFSAEAVSMVAHLRNRSPKVAGMTPYEALNGKKQSIFILYDATCYGHILLEERKKLDPKSRICMF